MSPLIIQLPNRFPESMSAESNTPLLYTFAPQNFGTVLVTVECTAFSRELISSPFNSIGLKNALEASPWLYPLIRTGAH